MQHSFPKVLTNKLPNRYKAYLLGHYTLNFDTNIIFIIAYDDCSPPTSVIRW